MLCTPIEIAAHRQLSQQRLCRLKTTEQAVPRERVLHRARGQAGHRARGRADRRPEAQADRQEREQAGRQVPAARQERELPGRQERAARRAQELAVHLYSQFEQEEPQVLGHHLQEAESWCKQPKTAT